MNALTTITPEKFISQLDGQLITSSLLVAQAFGKQHSHVLRSIESMDIPEDFASTHFWTHVQTVDIGNGARRNSKIYRMTKDGFMLLVMGFTGKKAMAVKLAYINAFNRMAERLAAQQLDNKLQAPDCNRQSHENIQALTDDNYRRDALDYVLRVINSCKRFADDNGIDRSDWRTPDLQKAASGIVADMLFNLRAEISFDSSLRAQIKIIQPGSISIMPNDADCMNAIAAHVVPVDVLSSMLQTGIKRLSGEM